VADVGSALPRALALRGDVEMALGQYDAARVAFEAAHGAAETAGALGVSVYAQARLARALLSAGRSQDANSLAAELFGDWKEGADEDREILRALGSVTGILGHVAASHSDFQEASEHYEISREYRRRAGDGIGASMATLGIGNCALFLSEFDAAAERYREAITEAQQIGYRRLVGMAKANIGDVFIQKGDCEQALPELREAEEILRRLGARDMLAETLRLLALALAAEDDLRAAEEAAEESLSLAEEFGQAPVAAGATKALEDIRQQRAKLKS
jgi:tetratricopeptide (TPR) repeat protein